MKTKELVCHLGFDSDSQVVHEFWDVQTVYRLKNGNIEINSLGRKLAYQCGPFVITRSWQQMPCRVSAFDAVKQIAIAGSWINTGTKKVSRKAQGRV